MLSTLNRNRKRNVEISIDEYRHLIQISTYCEQLQDKADRFADYVNNQVSNGYEMVDAETCGAILGFNVKNKPKEGDGIK